MTISSVTRKLNEEREKDWRDNKTFEVLIALIERKEDKGLLSDVAIEWLAEEAVKITDETIKQLRA